MAGSVLQQYLALYAPPRAAELGAAWSVQYSTSTCTSSSPDTDHGEDPGVEHVRHDLEDGCVDGGAARHQDPRVLAQPEAEPLGVHPLGRHLPLHQGPHLVDAVIYNIFYHIYNI